MHLINNLKYADDTSLKAENEVLNCPLMRVKEDSEKAGLKLKIQTTKIMAPGPITSWQRKKWKQWHFIFLGSKIIVNNDYSHEIKTLAPWKESSDKPRLYYKSRDITLLTNVHIVKVMILPVVRYRCESWTVTTEHQKTDAFQLWCCRRLFRVPWTVRRSNQSILKEINPEYSLEGLVLGLKHQYVGHLMWRADSLGKTLGNDARKDWRQKEKGAAEIEMVR